MKIFVRASSLLMQGTAREVVSALQQISKDNPDMTLADYLRSRLS